MLKYLKKNTKVPAQFQLFIQFTINIDSFEKLIWVKCAIESKVTIHKKTAFKSTFTKNLYFCSNFKRCPQKIHCQVNVISDSAFNELIKLILIVGLIRKDTENFGALEADIIIKSI